MNPRRFRKMRPAVATLVAAAFSAVAVSAAAESGFAATNPPAAFGEAAEIADGRTLALSSGPLSAEAMRDSGELPGGWADRGTGDGGKSSSRDVAPPAEFTASDTASDPAYEDAWTIGDNGGEGFGAWRQTGDKTPNHAIDGNGFAVYHDGAIGRSLETAEGESVSLSSGEFSVEALLGYTGSFSGFALYDADDAEILRWGVTTAEDGDNGIRTGFWYAIAAGGQNVYCFVQRADAETLLQTRLDFSLTWGASDGGTTFALSAGAGGETWASAQVELAGTRAVSAIGVLATGSSMQDALHFDKLSVSGTLSVPEPGSAALLALGAAVLAALRRKRT